MPLEWRISEGLVPYDEAEQWMKDRVTLIQKGHAQECVWLLEHPPLYTAGTSAKDRDLLHPHFPVFQTGRGGQYTYHGPGQRVCYVMLDLSKRQKDLKKYVFTLEEWGIKTLQKIGIESMRRKEGVGLWVIPPHTSTPSKIAAIGVRVSKWVTSHGIAFNISTNLDHYRGIVPCGLTHSSVARTKDFVPSLDLQAFDAALIEIFQDIDFFKEIT